MLQEDARLRLDEKLKEGYRLTTPERITLEYAARLCGAPPYIYSLTHLKNTLSSQNRTAKK